MSELRLKEGACWITENSMQKIVSESWSEYPLETGGVLMGYVSYNDIVITEVVGPGPRAIHKACSFEPDYLWQESQIATIYSNSGRIHTYLGDWHSHPDGSTCFSGKDKTTLQKIARNYDARMPFPIMAILSLNETGDFSVRRYIKERFFILGVRTFEMDVRIY